MEWLFTDRMLAEYSEMTLCLLLLCHSRAMTSETFRAEFDGQDQKDN